MDLIYLGITAGLLLLTWGLMKICEVPPDESKPTLIGDQKSLHSDSEAGGKS